MPFSSLVNSDSFAARKMTEDPLKFKGRYTVVNNIQKSWFQAFKKIHIYFLLFK